MAALSKRMQALARLVTPGKILCDVGCDHGFLPIALVEEGKIPSALALDINEGPLGAAREHIAQARLEDRIETRRSDGLREVRPGEAQSIVLAGMGGALTIHILTEGRAVAAQAQELILQPQSEIESVRRFLWQEGYVLLEEDIVEEEGKFYPMMKAAAGERRGDKPSETELLYGPLLLKMRHPILRRYIEKRAADWKNVQIALARADDTPENCRRRKEVGRQLELARQALACYDRKDNGRRS